MLKRYIKNQSANVAVAFAVVVIPVLIAVGVAVDYSRLSSAHFKLQHAADAAALSGALVFVTDGQTEMKASGENTYHANSQGISDLVIDNFEISKTENETVIVRSKAKLEPMFLQAFGYPKLDLSVTSEATLTSPRGMEIAIALDSSNSMGSGSRWSTTMTTMENTLEDMQRYTGQSEFHLSLVPFSDTINIGMSHSSWLGGSEPSDWDGCVSAREYPTENFQWSLDDRSPTAAPFASVPSNTEVSWGRMACPIVPITGPTNDVDSVIHAMRMMQPVGSGRFDASMAWAWRLLSPNWKGFWQGADYPSDYDPEVRKIIIFVSDGKTEVYTHHMSAERSWEWNQGSEVAFEHIVDLCERIKNEGIEIYMLKIDGNPHAIPYFQQCASSAGHYYSVSEPEDVSLVFKDILSDVKAELRLSR